MLCGTSTDCAELFFRFALEREYNLPYGLQRLLLTGDDKTALRLSDVARFLLAFGASNHNGRP
jgi:hypothetical protein